MDERLMKKYVGRPVPEWDLAHRLPIDRPVGPDMWDTGATFRINSTYMDVTEPSLMEKHWFITGVVLAFAAMGIGPYVYGLTHSGADLPPAGWLFIFDCLALLPMAIFGTMVWKLGRGLFFGLTRRPIRFHRRERKLYAIRKRRWFSKTEEGDEVWEAQWSKDSIFCLHKEVTQFNTVFHIRHYEVDEKGNVTRAFSLGREWTGTPEVELLLAQWNYWCKYMNDGPEGLPKPLLFHSEHENARESFLYALYGLGFRAPVVWRAVTMPLTLVFAAMRILANATCRDPVWPKAIEGICQVDSGDSYAEPKAGTPVGWGETVLAQQRGEYPNDPQGKVANWTGERDGVSNARRWVLDEPPRDLAGV
jgi:hypothetical protein